ncbi:MAG: hypothetical protein DI587_36065 [Variovorax paradoxus]|nr:MAG: hypothetical protein DI583_36065 [Variovorax paradoxus]PZQ00872.1 MAG: hypothetical protein DI587_36065 [Variovorax paradoxus]
MDRRRLLGFAAAAVGWIE